MTVSLRQVRDQVASCICINRKVSHGSTVKTWGSELISRAGKIDFHLGSLYIYLQLRPEISQFPKNFIKFWWYFQKISGYDLSTHQFWQETEHFKDFRFPSSPISPKYYIKYMNSRSPDSKKIGSWNLYNCDCPRIQGWTQKIIGQALRLRKIQHIKVGQFFNG